MASSQRQSSQRPENLTPRCQKRSCSHRRCSHQYCPPQGCCHTCPDVFWCPQCTRFWCDDCWEDVDAHQPIAVDIEGMKVHEKTTPKRAGGVQSVLCPQGTTAEEDPSKRLNARQEQENMTEAPHASPNPANQTERGTAKRRRTELPESSMPGDVTRDQALREEQGWSDYQMQLLRLEQLNWPRIARQEHAPHVPPTPPRPADQMEGGTPKRRQSGLPESSTSGNVTRHALQDYQMQMMLFEQQNKKRLLMARKEEESVTQAPHVPPSSSSPADQIERGTQKRRQSGLPEPTTPSNITHNLLQDYQMQMMVLERQNMKRLLMARKEQENAMQPSHTPGISPNPAEQLERVTGSSTPGD